MKKIITIKNVLSILMISGLLFSCKKEKMDATPAPTPNGMIAFHIHTNIDSTEVDSGAVGHDASGRQIQLNVAQFYFSNVVLKKSDGSSVAVNGVFMKTIGMEMYMIGEVPAGNYSSVCFQVGLDNTTNQTNPSNCMGGNVLSNQNPSMWFGSTSQGYMFMNVQGYCDTSAAHNGPLNQPFCYQLGTSASLKTINMPAQNFSVVGNQTAMIHIIADYGKLFQGIDFKSQNTATTFSNPTVAAQIVANIPSIFHYD